MSTIYEIDNTYVASTYKRFPVCIVSGKGSEVFDENGKLRSFIRKHKYKSAALKTAS